MTVIPLKIFKNKLEKKIKLKFQNLLQKIPQKRIFITNSFTSHDTGLSESINESIHHDFTYDSHFFTQELETFSCLAFLSTGERILKPMKLKLIPYFQK